MLRLYLYLGSSSVVCSFCCRVGHPTAYLVFPALSESSSCIRVRLLSSASTSEVLVLRSLFFFFLLLFWLFFFPDRFVSLSMYTVVDGCFVLVSFVESIWLRVFVCARDTSEHLLM